MLSNSRVVHVNSADRITGTNEQFTYSINMSPDEHYTHCCVLQASVPYSYFLVQGTYNTFELKEGVSSTTITVPAGNYNEHSFSVVVVSLLNANSPNGFVYAMTKKNSFNDTDDGKFYYTVSNNGGVQPQFVFGNYLHEQFGFTSNSTNAFVADSLVSTNVINFIPEQTLYIYSDLVKISKNNTDGVLQEIFANNNKPFTCVNYQCQAFEAYSKEINDTKTNSFTISLQNENGQIMNLNGRNMLITLLLYKKEDFYQIAKQYIKYRLS